MRNFPGNLEKLVFLTPALVSLFITRKFNIDPVNVPKLSLLVVMATTALFLLVFHYNELKFKITYVFPLICFNLALIISSVVTHSPWQLSFFGEDGRKTGLLTYICLTLLVVASMQIQSRRNISLFLKGLIFAGGANVIYGLLQINKIEFMDWDNVYHTALGTLGNPNFFASLVGISVSALFPLLLNKPSRKTVIFCVIYISSATVAILLSKSIQGIATILIGLIVTVFIRLQYSNSTKLKIGFYISAPILTLAGIAGMLQKGPLSDLIYKPSISLRGFYWHAGLNMFKDNFWFGVGPDAYGDWYRSYRSAASLLPPGGPDVNSNAAHNVFIDLAANGGIFAIASYLAILGVVIVRIVRKLRNDQEFDPLFATVIAVWVSYLAQSLISINQIGLAVWGWVSTGLLLSRAFDSNLNELKSEKNKPTLKQLRKSEFSNFVAGFGMIVGAAIAFIPLNADHQWYLGLRSGNLEKFVSAATSKPLESKRLLDAANILDLNKYPKESRKINQLALSHDGNFYYSWLMKFNSSWASESDKQIAKENLHRLDPLNPKWK